MLICFSDIYLHINSIISTSGNLMTKDMKSKEIICLLQTFTPPTLDMKLKMFFAILFTNDLFRGYTIRTSHFAIINYGELQIIKTG